MRGGNNAMTEPSGSTDNGNPAVDRMASLIEAIAEAPEGLTLGALVRRCGVSRSSSYRILNSLERAGLVRRGEAGAYLLGHAMLSLGERAAAAFRADILPSRLRGWMSALADRTGETVRVAVHDRGTIALVAAASPRASAHALGYDLREAVPLHAGGASKVLLAHLPAARRAALTARPLERFTERTITDRDALTAELERVRRQGWAHDPGEYSLRVQSYAVPLADGSGRVVAAASIAFAASEDAALHDKVRASLIEARQEAETLLNDLGDGRAAHDAA